MSRVLQLPAYRRLLAAYTLNELAWAIGSLTLAVLVYHRTGSAVGAMAFFLCSQFIPALFAPPLVARLDQRSVRVVLPALYALEGLAFLSLAWVAESFALVPVLALTIADGVIALTARSLARAATVAVISPVGLLREGNALTNTSFSVIFMAGPALGGAVVVVGGTTVALFANGGLFALISLTLATAGGLPRAVLEPTPSAGRLRAALAHARTQPAVFTLLWLQAAAVLFFAISIPVVIVFAQHSLHTGAGGYGALLTAWGGGAVAGSAVYARWRRLPARTLIALGAGALGAGLVWMAASHSLPVAIAGAAIAGAGNGIEAVSARTALQEVVPQRWMALIMSLNESIAQGVEGAGIVLGGAITAVASARGALWVAGVGALLVTTVVVVVLRPGRQTMSARGEGPAESGAPIVWRRERIP